MGLNVVQKIIKEHMVSGELIAGREISIRIDQTLTQDSTGTMAYLQFEAMGISKVRTKKSIAYIDHNTLQTGFENADDHKYIQTVASKYGIYFSKPGNGICHQVHLERFAVPGMTLLGSDSHTPTCGGIGMLAIGAGGLDVAVAMGGGEYYLNMPKVVKINLIGKLTNGVSAKDIILEVLRRLTVKGGVGRVFEYCGSSLELLSIPERATITNMGAELGATTSIFPSDNITKEFLKSQKREIDFVSLLADEDAIYDEIIEIDINNLKPLVALPHSPDNIESIKKVVNTKVDQVAIGSCTNSSYSDLMKVAIILKGRKVHPDVSLVISPGSKQVLNMMAKNGALSDLLSAGARILECACGPCIGMGQAPLSEGVSLRTFNRNFEGRSGTKSAKVYLVSPEVAAFSAIEGCISDPSNMDLVLNVDKPDYYDIDDSMVIEPSNNPDAVEVIRGPNIKSFPVNKKMNDTIIGKALIILPDNITTDHIMPSGASLLPYRSNIPYLSDFCLTPCENTFPQRAKENNGGFIIAGSNYGQGSSREHAALVPLYLGIKGVIAKSFSRIHMSNLVNSGILPIEFKDKIDYEKIKLFDIIVIEDAINAVKNKEFFLKNNNSDEKISVKLNLTDRQLEILIAGGLLNYTANKNDNLRC